MPVRAGTAQRKGRSAGMSPRMSDGIRGVLIQELVTHADRRGFFREIIRQTDHHLFAEGFGQWSHSLMYDGVTKAWHLHRRQTDWWYVCR